MSESGGTAHIETVCGPIAPTSLGVTLMHEHVLCDVTPPEIAAAQPEQVPITMQNASAIRYNWFRHFGNQILDSAEIAATELSLLKVAGGNALVELTTAGMKPDPTGLRAASENSGVHIIAGTGFYVEEFAADIVGIRSPDNLAAEMIGSLQEGFGTSGIKAGIIGEIGISDPCRESERRALQAAVIAQQETGAAINIHPGRNPGSPLALARFVVEAGGNVERLIISHLDRTLFTDDEVVALLDLGCVGEWDFFGIESSYYPFSGIDLPNDGQRLNLISRMAGRGFERQIAISQDICTKTRLTHWGGHGYAHLIENVVPMMRRKCLCDALIDQILIETPKRLLTLV
jgi:phosphotriesterase-related protein